MAGDNDLALAGTNDRLAAIMILRSNLPAVIQMAGAAGTVLDVGGWFQPLNCATHVLDLSPYETRRADHALDRDRPERFTKESWHRWDACQAPWPFPDRFFDFAFCSHTLEDLRDPLTVCRELVRVSRAGYVETPSRVREIFAKARFTRLKMALGQIPEIGFAHHRWFVEIEGSHIRFTAKDHTILKSRKHFITRGDIGRKLTPEESGIALFWRDAFTCEEVIQSDASGLADFRRRALRDLLADGASGRDRSAAAR
jgi:SAM-dependent methyltransferase